MPEPPTPASSARSFRLPSFPASSLQQQQEKFPRYATMFAMLQSTAETAMPPTLSPDSGGMVNLGHADKDLADEFKTLEEQLLIMPDGKQVKHNDREPFYGILTSKNSHFLGNPIGSVTIHIIHAKKIDTKTVLRVFPNSTKLDYYVRVDFLDRQYFTKLCVDVPVDETRVVFDHLVTFTIDDIAPNEGSEVQLVILNLIAVDEADPQRHIVIGRVEKLLLTFIQNMVASESLQLSRPAKINEMDGGYEGERKMGIMLVKSAFAYGRFGYGYSNQIFDVRMEPSDAIKHSLFPRYAPPTGRTQETGKVLLFRPIRPLDIFPFEANAHVGNPLLRLDRTEENEEDVAIRAAIPWTNPSLKFVPQLVKDQARVWRENMTEMKSTTRRVAFLQKLCTASPTTDFVNSQTKATVQGMQFAVGALPGREACLPNEK
ncbi:hypothetical protein BV898_15407 [Hypsibius exemplaris]|uniref:Uncharacterized protein n=1 Tax=Hypsibius exemplaris TaxID=2072580 RepID=A0A9X6NHS1_HYPEX|nr:hypothetical protein BV898_15407 [Hypsibius exemplaris]